MMTEIEILVCAAVVLSLLLELVPWLATTVDDVLVMAFVTIAAWPMYLALSWRQRLAPPLGDDRSVARPHR